MKKQLKIYYEYDARHDWHAGKRSPDDVQRLLGYFIKDLGRAIHYGKSGNRGDKEAKIELLEEQYSSNYIIVEITCCLTESEFEHYLVAALREHSLSIKQIVNEEEYIALLNIELKKHPEYKDGMVVIGLPNGHDPSGWRCEGPVFMPGIANDIQAIVDENYQYIAT